MSKELSKQNRLTHILLGLAILLIAFVLIRIHKVGITGQVFSDTQYMMHASSSLSADSQASPSSVASSDAPQCTDDGIQVCRCYCRVELTVCEDGSTSNASLPLCQEEWEDGDCSSISYFKTSGESSASCDALTGNSCRGFVRPGNGNPEELANQQVDGVFVGCGIATL